MPFIFTFVYSFLINTAIAVLLRPKPKDAEPSIKLEDLKFPTADRGRKVPLVVGRRHILSPNAVWFSITDDDIWQSGPGGVYTHYRASLHLVICHAPALLFNIHVDKKSLGLAKAVISENTQVVAKVVGFRSPQGEVLSPVTLYDPKNLVDIVDPENGANYRGNYVTFSAENAVTDPVLTLTIQGGASKTMSITIRGDTIYNTKNLLRNHGVYTLYLYIKGSDFVAGISTYSNGGVLSDPITQGIREQLSLSKSNYDPSLADTSAGYAAVSESFALAVNRPELFGGEKKGGGIIGRIAYLDGVGDPEPEALTFLESRQGGESPHYLGVCSLVIMNTELGTNTATLSPWGFDMGGYFNKLGVPDTWVIVNQGANAACFLYECLVNEEWGRGEDPNNVDKDTFVEVAETLHNEGIGCHFVWSESETIATIMDKVLQDIFGFWIQDPYSGGKISLKLLRAYSGAISDLRVLKPLKVVKGKARAANEGANQVIVNYKVHRNYEDESASYTVTSTTSLQLSEGILKTKTIDLPTIGDETSAALIANMHLMVESFPLATYTIDVDEFDDQLVPGEFVSYTHSLAGVTKTKIHRVLATDIKNNRATVTIIEDMYSYAMAGKLQSATVSATDSSKQYPTEVVAIPYQLYYRMSVNPTIKSSGIQPQVLGILNNFDSASVARWSVDIPSKNPNKDTTVIESSKDTGYFVSTSALGASVLDGQLPDTVLVGASPNLVAGHDVTFGYASTGEWLGLTLFDNSTLHVVRGIMGSVPRPIPAGTVIWLIPTDNPSTSTALSSITVTNSTSSGVDWWSHSSHLKETSLGSSTTSPTLEVSDYQHKDKLTSVLPPSVVRINGIICANHGQIQIAPAASTIQIDALVKYPIEAPKVIGAGTGVVLPDEVYPQATGNNVSSRMSYTNSDTKVRFSVSNNTEVYNTPSGSEMATLVQNSSFNIPSANRFTLEVFVIYAHATINEEVSEPYIIHVDRGASDGVLGIDLTPKDARPTLVEV